MKKTERERTGNVLVRKDLFPIALRLEKRHGFARNDSVVCYLTNNSRKHAAEKKEKAHTVGGRFFLNNPIQPNFELDSKHVIDFVGCALSSRPPLAE